MKTMGIDYQTFLKMHGALDTDEWFMKFIESEISDSVQGFTEYLIQRYLRHHLADRNPRPTSVPVDQIIQMAGIAGVSYGDRCIVRAFLENSGKMFTVRWSFDIVSKVAFCEYDGNGCITLDVVTGRDQIYKRKERPKGFCISIIEKLRYYAALRGQERGVEYRVLMSPKIKITAIKRSADMGYRAKGLYLFSLVANFLGDKAGYISIKEMLKTLADKLENVELVEEIRAELNRSHAALTAFGMTGQWRRTRDGFVYKFPAEPDICKTSLTYHSMYEMEKTIFKHRVINRCMPFDKGRSWKVLLKEVKESGFWPDKLDIVGRDLRVFINSNFCFDEEIFYFKKVVVAHAENKLIYNRSIQSREFDAEKGDTVKPPISRSFCNFVSANYKNILSNHFFGRDQIRLRDIATLLVKDETLSKELRKFYKGKGSITRYAGFLNEAIGGVVIDATGLFEYRLKKGVLFLT
jgi:hypothetical protein